MLCFHVSPITQQDSLNNCVENTSQTETCNEPDQTVKIYDSRSEISAIA